MLFDRRLKRAGIRSLVLDRYPRRKWPSAIFPMAATWMLP